MFNLFNPYFFSKHHAKCLTPLSVLFITFSVISLYTGLITSPPDYQQHDIVKIMYIHVPSAWLTLIIYSFIALCSFINIIWNIRFCYILSIAATPIGTMFAIITLVTGSIWGKPMWGTWWVWDARLTSMLILFLTYITLSVLVNSGDNILRAEKPFSVLSLVGFINIPIIKFSVNIWYSLHQGPSVFKLGGPSIHINMLVPLLLMFVTFFIYFLLVLILRTNILLTKIKNFNLANC